MYYEFYLDLYFIQNLIMNYLVLELAGKMLQRQKSVKRKAAAAGAGALGACILIIIPQRQIFALQMIFNLLLYLPVTALAFKVRDTEDYKQNITTVVMISIVMGSTWYFLTTICRVPFSGAVPAGYFFVWSVWKYWRSRRRNTQFLYDVRLERKGRAVFLKGFLDSGNHLRLPVTGKPVHIIEYEAAAEILSEDEQKELQRIMRLECPDVPGGKFFVIPYHTIGNNSGVLPVMEIDSICIKHGENVWSTKGVLAAVTETLSSKKEAYQMILHPQILK
ncbi:MAG: sigma-E processing peptidase SpoIIGA [Eubacteriales bacterium]|nr:sigma-E processing peptidase SpoIIGA [Eubacteriales bacterium]